MNEPERDRPFVIDCEAGRKAICTCGLSQNMPICDGSHKGTDCRPTILEFEEAKTVAICGCGKSGNLPYCDGSHGKSG